MTGYTNIGDTVKVKGELYRVVDLKVTSSDLGWKFAGARTWTLIDGHGSKFEAFSRTAKRVAWNARLTPVT